MYDSYNTGCSFIRVRWFCEPLCGCWVDEAIKIKLYIIVWRGLKEWGFQMFPNPKHSNGPITCHCSYFISSSSPAVIHKSLLSPLHNAASQASFGRNALVEVLVSPPSSLPPDTVLEKWNKRRAGYKRWDNIADQLFCLPPLLLSQTHNFLRCKSKEASLSWRREKFSLSTETRRRQNTRGHSSWAGQLSCPFLHPLCFFTIFSLPFSQRLRASRYLLQVILFETTCIHLIRGKQDAASSALSCW